MRSLIKYFYVNFTSFGAEMCKLAKYVSKLQIFMQSVQGKISAAGRDGHDEVQVCIQHVQNLLRVLKYFVHSRYFLLI